MDPKQERFENNVLLESELGQYRNSDNDVNIGFDNMVKDYRTLEEIASEYGRDIEFETRQFLFIIIYERMNRLNNEQRRIADLKYIHNRTVRDIAEIIGKSTTTVQYHIDKINKIIRSI